MSSFDEVKQAICQILDGNGQHKGTAFCILPGDYLLTCHHVVFGLRHIQIKIPGDKSLYDAQYLPQYSDPVSDIAVLQIPDSSVPSVQLGHIRDGVRAYGYG